MVNFMCQFKRMLLGEINIQISEFWVYIASISRWALYNQLNAWIEQKDLPSRARGTSPADCLQSLSAYQLSWVSSLLTHMADLDFPTSVIT